MHTIRFAEDLHLSEYIVYPLACIEIALPPGSPNSISPRPSGSHRLLIPRQVPSELPLEFVSICIDYASIFIDLSIVFYTDLKNYLQLNLTIRIQSIFLEIPPRQTQVLEAYC